MKIAKDIYSLNPKKVEEYLFYLLIFFLPTQLAYHFWPDWSFIFGIRIDYLAPSVYLTDVILVSLLLIWFIRNKTFPKFVFLIIVFALVNTAFSISPYSSFFKWIKVIELSLFAFFVSKNKFLIKTPAFIKTVSISLALVCLIGIAQFLKGGTIGGIFYFLGERSFNLSTPGIALVEIFGKDYLRPYSTFSHPNSFAGYLVLVAILTPNLSRFIYFLGGMVMAASASLSSYVGLASSYLFKNFSRVVLVAAVVISLLLPVINVSAVSENVDERLNLAKTAGEIISTKFFIGSGLNTFVYQTPLLQPVHNIFLLVTSELGIVGLMFFCWLLYKGFKKFPAAFIFIIVTGLFDHYWLTLQQNTLLFALVFGLVF